METTPRHPAVTAAIAGAIKDTELKVAKASLAASSIQPVDVTCRIQGTVSKGQPTPGASGTSPALVSFQDLAFFSEVLRRLKVEPAALKRVIRATAKGITQPSDVQQLGQDKASLALRGVIEQLAGETAAKLPPQPWTSAGRAAAVRFDLSTLTILESSPCPLPTAA